MGKKKNYVRNSKGRFAKRPVVATTGFTLRDMVVKKGLAKGSRSSLAKLVRSVAEPKDTNNDPVIYAFNPNNSTCSAAVDLIAPTLDLIAHGSQNGQRIGNRIYLKKFDLRLSFNMFPAYVNSASFRPGYVQIWLATLKDSPSTLPNATDLGRIYDDGSGASGPDGTMLATLRNLNRDYFNFRYYKKFKLGGASFGGSYNNNDYPVSKLLTIKNVVTGQVRYNDTTAVCNKYMFMFMTFTACDNTPVTTQAAVDCQFYSSISYTDV